MRYNLQHSLGFFFRFVDQLLRLSVCTNEHIGAKVCGMFYMSTKVHSAVNSTRKVVVSSRNGASVV